MHVCLASPPPDRTVTLCPITEQTPKAVTFLKTKGRVKGFPPPKAVIMLKLSQLQETT
jgi:hypothetical protein